MLTKSTDSHFKIYVNQTIILYNLNLHSDICQLFLNKTENNSTNKSGGKVIF